MDVEVVITMSKEDAESLRFDWNKSNEIFFGSPWEDTGWEFELVSVDGKPI